MIAGDMIGGEGLPGRLLRVQSGVDALSSSKYSSPAFSFYQYLAYASHRRITILIHRFFQHVRVPSRRRLQLLHPLLSRGSNDLSPYFNNRLMLLIFASMPISMNCHLHFDGDSHMASKQSWGCYSRLCLRNFPWHRVSSGASGVLKSRLSRLCRASFAFSWSTESRSTASIFNPSKTSKFSFSDFFFASVSTSILIPASGPFSSSWRRIQRRQPTTYPYSHQQRLGEAWYTLCLTDETPVYLATLVLYLDQKWRYFEQKWSGHSDWLKDAKTKMRAFYQEYWEHLSMKPI
jgi:hypothetical protein